MGKIGIYGGSFNPPHLGHALAVREMMQALSLDHVIMIPAAIPPHKVFPEGTPSGSLRLEMLSAAVSNLPNVSVSDMELNRTGPSYTVDTLRTLAQQYPQDELFLLMGSDMFLSFDQWQSPEEVCRYATIATASRSAKDQQEAQVLQAQAAKIESLYAAKTCVVENQFVDVSSTMVRRLLFFGLADSYLDPKVLDLIHANGLYGVNRELKNLPFEMLRKISLSLHKRSRMAHVVGCCQTSVELARIWGADPDLAARAGILHDITKALDKTAQLLLCQKYGIMISSFEQEHHKLLHAKTAAAVAEHVFGESEVVCRAIYWHTTGRAEMTLPEKILYLADYIEPNRSFDGVETLRDLAATDLDAALLLGFEMSIDLLQREGKALDIYSLQARDYLLSERNNA